MISKEEYRRRKTAQEARYRNKYVERWLAWWRNSPDRFAFLLVSVTAGVFAATVALWWATRHLVYDAEITAKRQLRAYVAAKPSVKGVTNFGSVLTAELEVGIQNSGQTPAIDLTNLSVLFPRPYPLPEDMDLTIADPKTSGSKLTLHPRDIEFGSKLTRTIEPLQYTAIKSGIARLYAFGTINYKDIFGIPHWTHFCYSFDGEGQNLTKWDSCPRYNDTDTNE
jgi:hypothetical protein